MGIRILAYRMGLFTLLRELQFSLAQMTHEPLAAGHVPTYKALRDEWRLVLLEEIEILDEISQGQAAVIKADAGLDVFTARAVHTVDEHTDGKTRKQIRSALLKDKSLAKFRRPVLAGQLQAMADWSDTLAKCGVPALIALAPQASMLVDAGRSAEALRNAAQKRNRDFRDVGMRKQFIDKVNAVRKETHGALAKLPFQNPALPQGFAETFFFSEAPRAEEETIDEVRTSVEELTVQLAERTAFLKKLEDEAAVEAQAAEDQKLQERAAEELEMQAQELLKRAAALKSKLKK